MRAEEDDIGVRKPRNRLWLPVGYVAAVLLLDLFGGRMVDWSVGDVARQLGQWGLIDAEAATGWGQRSIWANFDCFKFLFWFLIPLVVCLPSIDPAWFGWGRLKKLDYILLGVGVVLGVAVMFVIPLLPGLRDYYPSASNISGQEKLLFCLTYMVWTASWLPGWEFLHRYVLVQAMDNRWAGWGWVIVPISEGLYHLTKSPWECAGMVLFSVLATYHTVKRGNMLVAFLVHLVIEMALPLFMVSF